MERSGTKWHELDRMEKSGAKWTKRIRLDQMDRSGPKLTNEDQSATMTSWLKKSVATINVTLKLLDII